MLSGQHSPPLEPPTYCSKIKCDNPIDCVLESKQETARSQPIKLSIKMVRSPSSPAKSSIPRGRLLSLLRTPQSSAMSSITSRQSITKDVLSSQSKRSEILKTAVNPRAVFVSDVKQGAYYSMPKYSIDRYHVHSAKIQQKVNEDIFLIPEPSETASPRDNNESCEISIRDDCTNIQTAALSMQVQTKPKLLGAPIVLCTAWNFTKLKLNKVLKPDNSYLLSLQSPKKLPIGEIPPSSPIVKICTPKGLPITSNPRLAVGVCKHISDTKSQTDSLRKRLEIELLSEENPPLLVSSASLKSCQSTSGQQNQSQDSLITPFKRKFSSKPNILLRPSSSRARLLLKE